MPLPKDEKFAVDLDNCLLRKRAAVSCLLPGTDVFQLKMYYAEVRSCFVRLSFPVNSDSRTYHSTFLLSITRPGKPTQLLYKLNVKKCRGNVFFKTGFRCPVVLISVNSCKSTRLPVPCLRIFVGKDLRSCGRR